MRKAERTRWIFRCRGIKKKYAANENQVWLNLAPRDPTRVRVYRCFDTNHGSSCPLRRLPT